MGAPEIVVAGIAALTLLLGSGFFATSWRNRTRIRVTVFPQAVEGEYQVVVTIANPGTSDQHLEEIHLAVARELRVAPNSMAVSAIEAPVEVDLPARGRPAKHTFTVPEEWIDQRSDFYAKAKISAHEKPIRSKRQSIDQAVLNVLEVS